MSAIGIAGSKVFMGTTYGADKTFTTISNATEAVLSFAADPALAVNDLFELTSGWGEINGNVYRVKAISGSGPYLVTAEGLDTTNTTLFPAAAGAGTVREISAWTQITQVKDEGGITSSGGELTFKEYGFLEVGRRVRQPHLRNPTSLKVKLYEDPSLAYYDDVLAASKDRGTPYDFYLLLPNGAVIYWGAYVSLKEVPDFQDYLETDLDLELINGIVRYSA